MKNILIPGLLAALIATPLYAEEPVAAPAPNNSAGITKAAYLKRAEDRFNRVDTNHDGIFSREERKAARAIAAAQRAAHKNSKAAAAAANK